MLNVMRWGFIRYDSKVSQKRLGLGFQEAVKLSVFCFIVPGAPAMKMTLDAMLNLDMHVSFKLINILLLNRIVLEYSPFTP